MAGNDKVIRKNIFKRMIAIIKRAWANRFRYKEENLPEEENISEEENMSEEGKRGRSPYARRNRLKSIDERSESSRTFAPPEENHTVVLAGFCRRKGYDFRGPDDFFKEERHIWNRQHLFRSKKQPGEPINLAAKKVELIIYGGSVPMTAEGFKWKDVELIESVDKSTRNKYPNGTKPRVLRRQDRFESIFEYLGQFTQLEEVHIFLELRKTELGQVHSSADLSRLQYLLDLPGARVFVRFQLTKEHPEHPTPKLIHIWQAVWDQALDEDRRLNLTHKEKPEPKWPLSKSS